MMHNFINSRLKVICQIGQRSCSILPCKIYTEMFLASDFQNHFKRMQTNKKFCSWHSFCLCILSFKYLDPICPKMWICGDFTFLGPERDSNLGPWNKMVAHLYDQDEQQTEDLSWFDQKPAKLKDPGFIINQVIR
jgi:hypothetical protein